MLKDDVILYSKLTGNDGLYTPIGIVGAYLDGYEKGKEDAQSEVVRCKDCKYFESDHVENVNGIPLIVAHEICMRWGNGVKTSENGYCFLVERREVME